MNESTRSAATPPATRALLIGVGAGLLASAAAGVVDRLLDPLVTIEQKRREKTIREGSPHRIAGPRVARKMLGRELSGDEEQRARAAFGFGYAVLWGLIYTLVRRKTPQASRLMAVPFGVPLYLFCDGVIAPLLRLTPTIDKVPWQLDAKELANHLAWAATAEMVHRYSGRVA